MRVSTENQARGESPKNHEARARMYAELKGWEIVEKCDLSEVSGKSVSDHPEAQRMFADVKSGKVQGLVFFRLASNTRELLDFSEFFQELGAGMISPGEVLGTFSPTLLGKSISTEGSSCTDPVTFSTSQDIVWSED
ncbi:recombinase family protein [Geothermobacter hydrogeniphilus]|uniref:recombinase family protein n=1 Tax=Geothermobacter hydrogeniphilus TaxID=1969733 RepID=UPI001E64E1E4|nr:recombinase family protein [Geothermobacter hydrogeniphilus]